VTLFAILPFGNVSHHEAGIETKDGGDPGAPVFHNLRKKLLVNTVVAVVVWAIVMVIVQFGLIPLPEIPAV
jgi:predicted secreted protein